MKSNHFLLGILFLLRYQQIFLLAIVVDTTNPALFDSAAVMTDKTGLGIRILVDSQPVTFSQHVAVINPASPPKIEAVPVQDQSITLTEGAFEATMTLRADYL